MNLSLNLMGRRAYTLGLVLTLGLGSALGLVLALGGLGCGRIADPERIRVAVMDGEYITRGDLSKLLRDMPDDKRPKIRTRNDYRRVLMRHFDRQIKMPLGRKLAEEGKVQADLDVARELYLAEQGDDEDYMRNVWRMEVPPPGQITPLMEVYNLTPAKLQGMRNLIKDGAETRRREMLAERAVQYLAVRAFKDGEIALDEQVLQSEYDLRKGEFVRHEWIHFLALRFPAALAGAATYAAQARERLEAGADFDTLVQEQVAKDPRLVIDSEIENNPSLTRFKGFWESASGAETGQIIGPVYLPEYQQIAQDKDGRAQTRVMPDAYLILKVLECRPEQAMTLEEAKVYLVPSIIEAMMMKRLRDEHGVEVYDEKLPDPGQYRQGTGDPILDS